ncbi:uncharacterized protein EAE97_001454 [Botrytis byssoidea]|uniref:Uncharacterized protein n=1 Tax=Botrytis byssoidea TaxID=139641 RepID=A0A9P5IUI4_9HELO|nr:uncharacterized protein EAE97_001454 [Botrytis byssoidea]KAF7954056.1 hypothetical protein EAE97_001454 [Botrytis byssoidea]
MEISDYAGSTALIIACGYSTAEIVSALLEARADVNTQDKNGWTALMRTSERGDSDIIDVLLSRNSAVNISSSDKSTALTIASYYSKAEVVSKLLEARADVNAQDDDGDTPLILTARYGDANMVSNILDYQPDISKSRNGQRTAFHEVMLNHRRDAILPLLVEAPEVDINAKDSEERAPLYIATEGGYLNVVNILLAQTGVEVNASGKNDKTPLHIACEMGHLKIVDKLLGKNGVNVEAKDSNKQTPLHLACLNGKVGVIQKLLKRETKMKNLPGGKRPGAWSLLVRSLIKLLKKRSFASREELINTVKWAVTEDDFKYLMGTIGLWDTIIPPHKLQKSGIIGLLKQEIVDQKRSGQCSPQSPLQWAAFGGYHEIVWWLLQSSLPNKETEHNIEKARDIAIKERNWEQEKLKPKEDKDERIKKAAHLDQMSVSHDVQDSMKKDIKETGRKVAQQKKGLFGVIGNEIQMKSKSQGAGNELRTSLESYQITIDLLDDPPPFFAVLANPNDEDPPRKICGAICKKNLNFTRLAL